MANMHQKYSQDYLDLVEAGFIAVKQGDDDSANKLFTASKILNPSNTLTKIGFGYMHLCKLELKPAISIFEDITENDPKNELAQSLLGICMSFTPGNSVSGEKILTKCQKDSKDEGIQKLSEIALDFVTNHIHQKSSSPYNPKTDKNK